MLSLEKSSPSNKTLNPAYQKPLTPTLLSDSYENKQHNSKSNQWEISHYLQTLASYFSSSNKLTLI